MANQDPRSAPSSIKLARPTGRRDKSAFLAALRQAATGDGLTLAYHAQYCLATRQVTGFEALVRWRHPTRGLLPPDAFIPTAQRAGLIGAIGRWVLQQACLEAARWPAGLRVAVNVSASSLRPELVADVMAALAASGLPPHRLELEVTETVAMTRGAPSLEVLRALQAAGIRLAIDDFDTGYASYGYLIGFGFDKLKLDASLVAQLASDHARAAVARAVVRSVCALCGELGVACAAEGVETEGQLAFLAEAGCTEVQGFLLAEPVPAARVPAVAQLDCGRMKPAAGAPGAPPPAIPFAQIAHSAGDLIIVTDTRLDAPGPRILYVNPAFTRVTGFSAQEAIGRSPRMLQGPGTSRATLDRVGAALRAGEPVHEKILNYATSGAPYWLDMRIVPLRDALGRITHFAAIERDVTMDKRRLDELEYLADRDTLTGIPNRRSLLRTLEAELAVAAHAAEDGPFGLCLALADVDYFKQVNDTRGHAAGDAVLCGLADRLAENVRRADFVGRLGGEEFAVLMPQMPLEDAVALADRLRRAVARTAFDAPGGPVRVTVSIGVAGFAAGEDAQALLRRADAALYRAKAAGRDTVRADHERNGAGAGA
jgi:diguanylate cyclase (GGDEF)-like protein/PAS domain S-box-containing protein